MKITLNRLEMSDLERVGAVVAVFLANYAPRPKQRDCVIFVRQDASAMAVWGDKEHVRIWRSL